MSAALEQLTQNLSRLATHYDMVGQWPEKSLDLLTRAGAWTWIVPRSFGGLGLDPFSQIQAYEAVAAGCMTCLLILTQRDGACEFIASGTNEDLKSELLPRLVRNEAMTSIGISQLTTSRRGGRQVLTARPDGEGFRLSGYMPWVTSAEKCELVVTAAATEDNRQVLAVVPIQAEGVFVDPPMKLMALEASRTSEVHCREVFIEPHNIIRGPEEDALKRRSPVKSLVVVSAGLGLARALLADLLRHVSDEGSDMLEMAEEAKARFAAVRERVLHHAGLLSETSADIPKNELRIAVNDLLQRLAVAALTNAKGSGFIRQRDTQRLAREAMFFLVWSAPDEVRAGTLAKFFGRPDPVTKSMLR
jgi:alkylation response protein AidB-like acyl-CoA dehydrogenase